MDLAAFAGFRSYYWHGTHEMPLSDVHLVYLRISRNREHFCLHCGAATAIILEVVWKDLPSRPDVLLIPQGVCGLGSQT